MKTTTNYIKVIAILIPLVVFFCLAQPCYANPIDPNNHVRFGPPPFVLWIISPLVEALLIIIILKWRFTNHKPFLRPFLIIYLLNFITLPITQVLASFLVSFLFKEKYLFLVYSAEIFPIITEFIVLFWLFQSLYRRGSISKTITPENTLIITLIANLATFLIGFAFYRYFPSFYTSF
jgi:hypothetical protein